MVHNSFHTFKSNGIEILKKNIEMGLLLCDALQLSVFNKENVENCQKHYGGGQVRWYHNLTGYKHFKGLLIY